MAINHIGTFFTDTIREALSNVVTDLHGPLPTEQHTKIVNRLLAKMTPEEADLIYREACGF